jgi:hypothetical protein
MITIQPEFPNEEGPELLSVVLLIEQMVLKKGCHIFRIEESFLF